MVKVARLPLDSKTKVGLIWGGHVAVQAGFSTSCRVCGSTGRAPQPLAVFGSGAGQYWGAGVWVVKKLLSAKRLVTCVFPFTRIASPSVSFSSSSFAPSRWLLVCGPKVPVLVTLTLTLSHSLTVRVVLP